MTIKRPVSALKSSLRVGQMVEMLLKWQYVRAAGCALRASLGTRFTRTQVTQRSSCSQCERGRCQISIGIPTARKVRKRQLTSKYQTETSKTLAE